MGQGAGRRAESAGRSLEVVVRVPVGCDGLRHRVVVRPEVGLRRRQSV